VRLTHWPRPVSSLEYERAVAQMVKTLLACSASSVFQIGNVGTPGISDVDMLAVFEDDHLVSSDPRSGLSPIGRYLFTHPVFGVSRTDFERVKHVTFFHNYRHLAGEELSLDADEEHSSADIRVLREQTALEYLVRMWIAMTLERNYGVLHVRHILLTANALAYDLEFLGVDSGKLHDSVQLVRRWRARWFAIQPGPAEIVAWFESCYEALREFLEWQLTIVPCRLPETRRYRLGRNLFLQPGNGLRVRHRGITLPWRLAPADRRAQKIQSLFNRFVFEIPCVRQPVPLVLRERFDSLRWLRIHNRERLPHFIPLASSLALE
jgi:hypothetical protein